MTRPMPRHWRAARSSWLIAALLFLASSHTWALTAAETGLVINTADPYSVAIGEYYQARRRIPDANVVRLNFDRRGQIPPLVFAAMKRRVDAQLPRTVQVLALAWTAPFRVECMSITAAFAFGFDRQWCATGCVRTPFSPYFNSDTRRPFTDLGVRPTMSLAARSITAGKALIDRGVASDGSNPTGSAYLLSTRDDARNARAPSYGSARLLQRPGIAVRVLRREELHGKRDVMFYFIGRRWIGGLRSNRFLPGAVADHLTSTGGVLEGGRQMSAVNWLEAGATGSYGTVVEPCAITGKFPSVPLLLRRYLAGETLIEAYWKSVAMPSQGVFIGEPLAAPFRRRS
jgi:uncharacterized protein (TIGR03790 family)